MSAYHHVKTSQLDIAYLEWNPAGARTAVLLHGWPDSPECWNSVADKLAASATVCFCPALRGFGPTRFLRADTPRSGELAALGRDLLDFRSALGLERPVLVGHDWGGAAGNACSLDADAASHLVLLSVGYGTNSLDQPVPLSQARNYWYHWFMATPRARPPSRQPAGIHPLHVGHLVARRLVRRSRFRRSRPRLRQSGLGGGGAAPYRQRWGHAQGDPAYAEDAARLTPAPVLAVPTLVLHGGADACNSPATSEGKDAYFSGRYQRRVLDGIGHFPQREAPQAVAQAILRFCEPA